MWWASGNARQPEGPQAREAGRLDRRVLGTQRAGVGPAPSQGIFIGRLVIVSGSGGITSGVFIYNGTPGLGNPPQIAEVPSGVTTDPYGNAITSSKILMQGNVITMSAGTFRTAATAPLIQLDGTHDAEWIYNASAVMVAALASTSGNDGLGNTYPAGITAFFTIASGTGAGRYQVSLTDQVGPYAQFAALTFQNLTHPANQLPAVVSQVDTVQGAALQIKSGKLSPGDFGSQIQMSDNHATQASILLIADAVEVTPSATTSATFQVVGTEILNSQSVTPSQSVAGALFWADSNGIGRVIPALSGDTSSYFVGVFEGQVNPRSQAITPTAPANITGLSKAVGIGTYIVKARMIIEWNDATSTSQPQMRFAGPTISQFDVSFTTRQSGTGSTANTLATVSAGTGSGTGYNGATLINLTGTMSASGIFFDLDVWGMFVFTASGTLTLQAAESAVTAGWTVVSGFWEIVNIT